MDQDKQLWTDLAASLAASAWAPASGEQRCPTQSEILEAIHDAMFATDACGIVTYWNASAAQMFGREASDVLGKSAYALLAPLVGRKACLEAARKLACGGCYSDEIDCRQSDGPAIRAEVHAKLIRDVQGQPIGAVFSIRDISKCQAIEQALRDSETRAMRLVETLQVADRYKNHALGIISHELRDPLAAVTLGLSLLKRIPLEGALAKKTVDMLERQANQLTRLVDDLLDATRIDADKIKLQKTVVNINSLVSRIVADSKAQFDGKGIELTIELAPEPLMTEADTARLTQIVANLLHNAWKFTERGGMVKLQTARAQETGDIQIMVTDSGIGFQPGQAGHLFQPFSQADTPIEHRHGGLGLGLSIVKGLAELHGGRVEACSGGLGRGSRFTVILPASPPQPEQASLSSQLQTPPSSVFESESC